MTPPCVIVPTYEVYCTASNCEWSSCAESFSEAEDRATEHELSHEAAA